MPGRKKRTSPKGLTSRFPACKRGKPRTETPGTPCVTSFTVPFPQDVPTFETSKLPALPEPSMSLQKVLLEFNVLNQATASRDSNTKARSKKLVTSSKDRRMNGFFAFRAFYCRSILDPLHQRRLSILLGKIWENEPGKLTWSRYATEFNARKIKSDFVEWLCGRLHFDLKVRQPFITVVRNDRWKFSTESTLNSVEDVYLEKKQ